MDVEGIAEELLILARERAVDLAPHCRNHTFGSDERYLVYWRQGNVLYYRLQGAILKLPTEYRDSPTAFQGMWTEAGTVESVEEAYDLLKAWILDGTEVDDLPKRAVRRNGISGA
jgi:hypothetical protein